MKYIFALLLTLGVAYAQNPSPGQLGLVPNVPNVVQVLDSTNNWSTIGTINPTTHIFSPINGSPPSANIAIGSTIVTGGTDGCLLDININVLGCLTAIPVNVTRSPYNADPTGVLDSTAGINAALAVGGCVYVPKGTYKVTDALIAAAANACVYGDGRTLSILNVNSASFNLAALGVMVLGANSGGAGAIIHDIGIFFTQPQTASRGSIVAFPPAIYAQGHSRAMLRDIRVSAANTCLDARGNDGGWFINNFECGALTTGMFWDGALDGVHIHGWHFWDFGITGLLQTGVYSDGLNTCMSLGRVDGLMLDDSVCFYGNVVLTSNAGASAGRLQFSNVQFDSSIWQQVAGIAQVTNVEWVGGNSSGPIGGGGAKWPPYISLTGSGAVLRVENFYISGAGVLQDVDAANGHLELHNGFLRCSTPGATCASVEIGFMGLYNVTYEPNFGSVWTVPFISQNSGNLQVRGGWFDTAGNVSGSGSGITFASDGVNNLLDGVDPHGWPVNLPASTTSGVYWPQTAGLSITSVGTTEAKASITASGAAPADVYFKVNGNSQWVLGVNSSDVFNFGYPGTTLLQATKSGTLSVTGGGVFGIPKATWPNNQTCTVGQISVDASFIYVCTAADTVKRAALSAF